MSEKKRELKGKGWNFAFVPKEVFLSKDLDHADVRVYCYLLWRQGQNQSAWPSVKTMADDMGMSEGAVKRSLKSLIKNDWIRRERKFMGSSTTYIYEKQSDCRSDHGRSDVRITGDLNVGSPDSRLNESHINESQTTSAETPPAKLTSIKSNHPVIQLVREITKRYPNTGMYQIIVDTLGESPDPVKLSACYVAWCKRGYNPKALTWALDWYKTGIPSNGNAQPKPAARSGGWNMKAINAK